MYDTGIADRCRAFGLTVIEVDGWQTRGRTSLPAFAPRGSVDHHTVAPLGYDAPSLGVVINGRSGLPGPLSNLLISRSNLVYVVAAGKCNHAGAGGWNGLVGNNSCYGIERENTGYASSEPWRDDQTDVAARAHAALIAGRAGSENVCEHKEWTDQKVDAHTITGEFMRGLVARYLAGPPTPAPTEEQDMTPGRCLDKKGRQWFYAVGDDKNLHATVNGGPFFRIGGVWTSGVAASLKEDGTMSVIGRGNDGVMWECLVFTDGSPKPGAKPEFYKVGGHIFPPA